jgi:hypothetical protein
MVCEKSHATHISDAVQMGGQYWSIRVLMTTYLVVGQYCSHGVISCVAANTNGPTVESHKLLVVPVVAAVAQHAIY